MPAAVAIPLIVGAMGAGGTIAGGLIGSSAAGKASNAQQAAAAAAGQVATDTAETAAKGITDATTAAAGGVNQATQSGLQGATDLTREGITANQTGTNNANMTLADLLKQLTQNQSGYTGAGNDALQKLQQFLSPDGAGSKQFSFNGDDFRNTPGYQFQLDEGMKALQRGGAASGKILSGSQLKDLNNYAQGVAEQGYGAAYKRASDTFQQNRDNTINPLMNLANLGQTATQNVNAGTVNIGGQIAGNQADAGRFAGTSLNRLGEFTSSLGLQGATAAGNFLSQGANSAGNFRQTGAGQRIGAIAGGANAAAAGSIAQGNIWGNVSTTLGTLAGKTYKDYQEAQAGKKP